MPTNLEILARDLAARGLPFQDAKADFERTFILKVMERTKNNQSKAARLLGIHRNTLARYLESFSAK